MTKAGLWGLLGVGAMTLLLGLTCVAVVGRAVARKLDLDRGIIDPKGLEKRWRTAGLAWRAAEITDSLRDGDRLLLDLRVAAPAKGSRPSPAYLALARKAAATDGFSYGAKLDRDPGSADTDLSIVQNALGHLGDEAVRRAEKGDSPGAIADLAAARRLADGVARAPFLFPKAAAFSLRRMVVMAGGRVLLVGEPSAATRAAVRKATIGAPIVLSADAYRNEGVALLAFVRSTEGEAPDGWPKRLRDGRRMAAIMESWLRLNQASNGFRDLPALRKATDNERARIRREGRRSERDLARWLPNFESEDRVRRKLETTELLLGALADGGRPTPKDPFGRPIRWSGPRPYSLGPDGKDDGGDPAKDWVLVGR